MVESILVFLRGALERVNDPVVKSMLAMAGGWLWNRHGETINKAIPAVLAAASIAATAAQFLVTVISGAFPDAASASFATYVGGQAVSFSPVSTIGWIFTTMILPPIFAVGAHSWPKNFFEWVADGRKLFRKT